MAIRALQPPLGWQRASGASIRRPTWRPRARSSWLAFGASPILDKMVDRFLAWPLPDSVCADLIATRQGSYSPPRVGTNLLTATEARQMLEHVLQVSSPESPAKEQAGEVAEMVKRLRAQQTRIWNNEHELDATRRLIAEAAALIEKLGQGWIPDNALSFCEDCGMYIVSKPPHRSAP